MGNKASIRAGDIISVTDTEIRYRSFVGLVEHYNPDGPDRHYYGVRFPGFVDLRWFTSQHIRHATDEEIKEFFYGCLRYEKANPHASC